MPTPIKTAVIGTGYLGKFHAEKYADLPQCQLIAVCDIDATRCAEIAQRYQVKSITPYQALLGLVDAVSIAVPTSDHYEVAKFFLENKVHVLLEKPITVTLQEADALIEIANRQKVILQIGHLERFNNVLLAVENYLAKPRFIESIRLAPFKLRAIDVNVVLDLMIHDIDIIQSIAKSPIKRISANGASVLTSEIDIANARIEFTNGCVANVTASRVSLKMERRMRIFQNDCYIMLDLDQKLMAIHRKGSGEMFPGIPEITRDAQTFEQGDALKEQISSFLNAIIHNSPPIVSGEDGRRALETALEITRIVNESNEQYAAIHA